MATRVGNIGGVLCYRVDWDGIVNFGTPDMPLSFEYWMAGGTATRSVRGASDDVSWF